MIPGKQYNAVVILGLAWRRKWLILVPALAVAIGTAVYARRLPNRYRSETLIRVVPQRIPERYVSATVTTRIEDRLQAIKDQTMSRTRLERIIEEFTLYANDRKTGIMEDIVERMRTRDIVVEVIKGDAFRVSFSGDDPVTVMKVTERLASLFIDESLRERETLVEGTDQFLEAQLEDARKRLIANETKAAEYRRRFQGELPNQLTANMQGLHNAETQLQTLVDSMNRDYDRRLVLERRISEATAVDMLATPAAPSKADAHGEAETGAAPLTGSPVERLRIAEASLRALELRLTPEHPDVVNAKRLVADLQHEAEASQTADHDVGLVSPAEATLKRLLTESKEELENLGRQIASKTTEEERLRGVIAVYQKRIEAAPTREVELAELTRDYDTIQATYRDLLGKKQSSQIAANLERRQGGEQFKVLDAARRPERPYSPDRRRLYGMGLLAGFGLGFLLAAVLEYFDRTMRTEEDIRIALNLPVLATFPLIQARVEGTRWRVFAVLIFSGLVVLTSVVATAWRLLE